MRKRIGASRLLRCAIATSDLTSSLRDQPEGEGSTDVPSDGTAASLVSLYQTETTAARVSQTINWTRATSGAVQVLRNLSF